MEHVRSTLRVLRRHRVVVGVMAAVALLAGVCTLVWLGGHAPGGVEAGPDALPSTPGATSPSTPRSVPVPTPATATSPSPSPSGSASRPTSALPSPSSTASRTPTTPATTTRPPAPAPPPAAPPAQPRGATRLAYLTGYTWWDNTPPGSPQISHAVLHRVAGGSGTYADPITVAVGHSLATGRDVLDIAPGTRIYAPGLRRYGVVEDTCGDGAVPQNGPCHLLTQARLESGMPVSVWLDWYMGGQGGSAGAAAACANRLTRADQVVLNPGAGLPVTPGPLIDASGVCRF